jgi:hypothetical protein
VHLFLEWIISTGESLNLDIDFVVLITLSLNVVRDLDVDHAMMLLSKLLLLTTFLLHVFLPIAVESSDRSRELISQLGTNRFILIVLQRMSDLQLLLELVLNLLANKVFNCLELSIFLGFNFGPGCGSSCFEVSLKLLIVLLTLLFLFAIHVHLRLLVVCKDFLEFFLAARSFKAVFEVSKLFKFLALEFIFDFLLELRFF